MARPDRADPAYALALPTFRPLYRLTALVALLVAADVVFWYLGWENYRNPFGVNLSLIAAVIGGARIVYGALVALLEGNVGADLALAIAMVAALMVREYWVAAEVVLIAMIGESLEAITFSRTHRELQRIFELRPRTVRLRRADQVVEVPVSEVEVGDVVLVRPGERVAVDGTVLAGRSAVDQSTLTGETLPVDKGEGDSVFAGTINQFGAIEIRADVVGEQTTLGQVIKLVTEARRRKADVERVADRLARYFLPCVLLLALGTFAVTNRSTLWQLYGGEAATAGAWIWMPTLAVLVVTCPCALVLATPAAMMAALAWLARRGVLTTGGAALERLASVSRMAFDKTGTLTEGKLQLCDCVAQGEHDADQVLAWAATAEQSSEHPIGRVIVQAAQQRGLVLPGVRSFEALPGAGVRAVCAPGGDASPDRPGEVDLLVGSQRLMKEQGLEVSSETEAVIQRLESAAQSTLLLAVNREIVGVLGVRDTVRPEAARIVQELRESGIEQLALLTGDRHVAAVHVAEAVGIDRFASELLPDEKANWLADWALEGTGQRPPGVRVAMVGDGVNDAPALATADVGLALGGVGSDIAAEAGDLILMGDPLAPLPGLLRLSREAVRIIRQNILVFAFGFNIVGIALTAWIMPTWSEAWLRRSPVAAALFHQFGSLLVLLNAMRLLWFERWNRSWLGRLELWGADQIGRWTAKLQPAYLAAGWLWRLRGQLAYAAAVLLLAAYLTQVVVFVQPDEVAVVKRFGRFHAVLDPGPHLRLPPPWDQVIRQRPGRVRTVEIGLRRVLSESDSQKQAIEWNTPHEQGALQRSEDEVLILTGDQSLVELAATVQYRVNNVAAFLFGVRDPERLLKAITEGVVREVIAAEPLLASSREDPQATEILTTARARLASEVRERLQARADALQLGVEILPDGVCLQDVHPPLAVVGAFRDVSSAFKERERMKNEANAVYRERLIKAGGEAVWREFSELKQPFDQDVWARMRPQLSGEAAAEINSARAFAAQQEDLATGQAASFLLTEAAHEAAPELTRWRLFLDTLEQVMPGKQKLILDGPSAGRRHLLLGMPQDSAARLLPLLDAGLPGAEPDE